MEMNYDDLDIETDKIKVYLRNKLDEITAENAKLVETISERKMYLEELLNKGNYTEPEIAVELLWKKMRSDKFCIGFGINLNVEEIKMVFKYPTSYEMHMYTKKYHRFDKNVHKLKDIKYVVLSFDTPSFTDSTTYKLNGVFDFGSCVVTAPEVIISTLDCTDRKVLEFVVQDNITSLLVAMSCMKHIELVFIFPTSWHSSMDNAFEIYCGLRKLNVQTEDRTYFVADNISTVFNDTVLETYIDRSNPTHVFGTLYYQSSKSVTVILHHFLSSVKGLQIYQRELYEYLPDTSSKEQLREVKDSITKELKLRVAIMQHKEDVPPQLYQELTEVEQHIHRLSLRPKE